MSMCHHACLSVFINICFTSYSVYVDLIEDQENDKYRSPTPPPITPPASIKSVLMHVSLFVNESITS